VTGGSTTARTLPAQVSEEPSFRAIFTAGAPRFLRELFGPVVAFYVGLRLGGLVVGILVATAVGIALELYERRRGRGGALALVSVAFVLVQALVGLVANSAVVYLAQSVMVSGAWGLAFLASAVVRRPLAGVFADAWYASTPSVKASDTYRRVFGLESVVWGVYLLARSGIRMLVLATGSIGGFVVVQLLTGAPVAVALMAWSVWYAVRAFGRSDEWDSVDAAASAGGGPSSGSESVLQNGSAIVGEPLDQVGGANSSGSRLRGGRDRGHPLT